MCQIIYKPEYGQYEAKQIKSAIETNRDSVGIVNLQTMETIKIVTPSVSMVTDIVESMDTFILHARFATNGGVSTFNAHPFEVNGSLYMHNGVLGSTKVLSHELLDSRVFVEALYPLIESSEDSALRFAMVEAMLDYSKLVRIKDNGEVIIFNETLGDWVNGCWYSAGYNSTSLGHSRTKSKKQSLHLDYVDGFDPDIYAESIDWDEYPSDIIYQ